MEVFLIYPVFIGIAVATAELARSKGYRGRWWFFVSLVLPLIPALILFMLKPSSKPQAKDVEMLPPLKADKILYQKAL